MGELQACYALLRSTNFQKFLFNSSDPQNITFSRPHLPINFPTFPIFTLYNRSPPPSQFLHIPQIFPLPQKLHLPIISSTQYFFPLFTPSSPAYFSSIFYHINPLHTTKPPKSLTHPLITRPTPTSPQFFLSSFYSLFNKLGSVMSLKGKKVATGSETKMSRKGVAVGSLSWEYKNLTPEMSLSRRLCTMELIDKRMKKNPST